MNKLLLLSWSLFKGSCDMVSMKQGYFPYSRLFRTLPAWYYFWILFLKTPTTSWLKITAIIWEASTSLSFYIHVHTHTNIHIKNYKDYSLTAPQKKKKKNYHITQQYNNINNNIKQEKWKHIAHQICIWMLIVISFIIAKKWK